MAENKEQLRISAELDTSKLKQQAQQGLGQVVNEEKKVENQAKRASKALDNVGNSATKAAQKGTQALKQMGNEAKTVTQNVDKLSNTVKSINFKQGLHMAGQAAQMLIPMATNYAVSSGAMDAGDANILGSALQGGMQGAMMGSVLGPLGAAGGALLGAATALIQASDDLKEAAKKELDKNLKDVELSEENYDKIIADRKFNELLSTTNISGARAALSLEDSNQSEIQGRIADIRKKIGFTKSNIAFEMTQSTRGNNRGDIERLNAELKRQQEALNAALKEESESYRRRTMISAKIEQLEREEEAEKKRQEDLVKAQTSAIESMKKAYALGQENKGIVKSITGSGGGSYDEIMHGLQERAKELQEKLKKSVGDQELFNKTLAELNDVKSNIEAAKSGNIEALGKQNEDASKEKSMFERLASGGGKLTDALTRVGGGAGYASNISYQQLMSRGIQSANKTLEAIKQAIEKTKDTEMEVVF